MTQNAMIRQKPAPPLDTLIDCFWWSCRPSGLGAERILPTGSASLVFWLDAGTLSCWAPGREQDPVRWSASVLHGPQSTYYTAGPKRSGRSVGVAFRPGAVGAVIGRPASEIAGQHIPLDQLWGTRATRLHERLCAARTPHEAFRILAAELTSRLTRPLLIHPAVAASIAKLAAARPGLRLASLSRESGWSDRHFIARFRAATGLTPHLYYRLGRFSAVLRAVAEAESLADIAASKGYADQSHLNREFKAFSGTSPLRYAPRNADSPNHHVLDD